MMAKITAETGRSMKSSGLSTRARLARNFSSMMRPSTMPSTMGTSGSSRRRRTKPSIPKAAATAQSIRFARNE